jgi:hypothetical protein
MEKETKHFSKKIATYVPREEAEEIRKRAKRFYKNQK